MWKPASGNRIATALASIVPVSLIERRAAPQRSPEPAVAGREREEFAGRLYHVERSLIGLRVLAMVFWGGMILWEGRPFGVNFSWISYLGSLLYCTILHSRLNRQANLPFVAWVATIGDSTLTFLMCLSFGGPSSVFIPFFYFTIFAADFRYGGQRSVVILLVNALLILTLYMTAPPAGRHWEQLTFILLYLTYSFVLGRLLAGWATFNLRRALRESDNLSRERDRTQALLHSLINAQEEERKKMAGDLHDRLGGRFFSISHGLDECVRKVADASVRAQIAALRTELLACSSYIRSFMNELRPTVLDELGLSEAIAEYVGTLAGVVPFTISTRLDPALRGWRSREDAMLFRLVQEALLNARKHSGAKVVRISLQRSAGSVVLCIEDDGRGFDPAATPVGHFGLLTMRERAEVSGGALTIDSAPGRGTRVSVRFNHRG